MTIRLATADGRAVHEPPPPVHLGHTQAQLVKLVRKHPGDLWIKARKHGRLLDAETPYVRIRWKKHRGLVSLGTDGSLQLAFMSADWSAQLLTVVWPACGDKYSPPALFDDKFQVVPQEPRGYDFGDF